MSGVPTRTKGVMIGTVSTRLREIFLVLCEDAGWPSATDGNPMGALLQLDIALRTTYRIGGDRDASSKETPRILVHGHFQPG